jgi:hypothetical protein
MYAEFSAENTKDTQHLKLGDSIGIDVKEIG